MNSKENFQKEIIPAMMKKFGYKNKLAVPRLMKITVNTGIGRFSDNAQRADIKKMLEKIVGQKVVERGAKQAIASFKTRQGSIVAYSATLRGKRMHDFFERTVGYAIPRIRDFRGINKKSVDQGGNLSLGFKESLVFPEIIGEDVKTIFGLEVTFVTNAKSREEALELFKIMGVPFIKD
ncbi:MAG: 50S ribosomal protein L5 [Patescibacteria group bacterium]